LEHYDSSHSMSFGTYKESFGHTFQKCSDDPLQTLESLQVMIITIEFHHFETQSFM